MVEETIKTIKETERQAEALVKKADEDCASILANAKAEAEKAKAMAEMEARENANALLAAEKEAGERAVQEALRETEKDISVLKEKARSKEGEVISAVIAQLV